MRTDKERPEENTCRIVEGHRGMGVFLPVKTVSVLVNRWYDQKNMKTVQPVWTAPQKYDLFNLYSARKAKIYLLYCFHRLQRFAMRFFRLALWITKYAASSTTTAHMQTIA